ncbi:serine--tRNA ligase [uncultured Hoeflea sp.]|uniref:serine--tRNA ligase n=1 Tax=uncultured Hoeflea sp. TaxID=538666 RepID=UPI00261097F3|nr:serine--tRNA ligase [uncultured Hoeflea sp.]
MLDIKWIRENPTAFDAAMAKRGLENEAGRLIALDEARRSHVGSVQALQERRNAASKDIGKAMASKDQARADALKAEVAKLKDDLQAGEAKERALDEELKHALSVLPNMPLDEVPVGKDESDNVEVRLVGEKPALGFAPREHFELGEALGMMDFERAAKMSGSRFTIVSGKLARLERALGQFMLDLHTADHGYREINPPLLVNDAAAYGTDKLPKFGDDLFRTTDGRWLIPTAEVPLTYMAAGEILAEEELPLRYTAQTACFRSEAGSAGRDTRGMLRQHQFTKVELVSVTTPETSLEEHERMTASAEQVLKLLGLHFRTVVLCTGDMGFGAQKTYDLEVWLPGQDAYREISSCSVCGDFQARRMNARCRKAGDKATRFVHTLNGSGVAVGRALIAVMENYQNADGSITVPEVLRPYMGGLETINKSA